MTQQPRTESTATEGRLPSEPTAGAQSAPAEPGIRPLPDTADTDTAVPRADDAHPPLPRQDGNPIPVPPPMAELSCEALAYLGDSVLELMARKTLVCRGMNRAAQLNREARRFVCAPVQARAMGRILPYLREVEAGVYRRGRNNIHANVPKSATVAEYRNATGMECLFAYLYLTGQKERAWALFRLGYED